MELFFLKEKFGYTRYVQGQTLTIEQQLARLLLSPRLSGSLFVSSQTMNLFCSHVPPDIFNRITPLLQLLLQKTGKKAAAVRRADELPNL
jgi:hypothetical protein